MSILVTPRRQHTNPKHIENMDYLSLWCSDPFHSWRHSRHFLAEKEYLIWKNFRAYSLSSFYKTLTGDQIFEMDSFLKYFCQNYNFAFDKSHSNDFLQVLEILPVKKGRWSAVKY